MTTATATRPLRILQISHVYYPTVCGSELLFRHIAEGLAERGCEVGVFTSTAVSAGDLMTGRDGQRAAGCETWQGVQIRRLRHRRFSALALGGIAAVTEICTALKWPAYGTLKAMKIGPHLPGLVRRAVEFEPDVIAAVAAPCLTIFRAAEAARRARKPFVVMPCLHSDHDWFMDNPDLLGLLRGADGVMALTEYELQLLQALGVRRERLWRVGGGVAPQVAGSARRGLRQECGLSPADPLVLFFGRQEESKGLFPLVAAMEHLWAAGRAATLVIAGSPTAYSRTRLAERIAALPPDSRARVFVRGQVAEEEKWGWYSECDVLAHPARDESFGLVYLEAWACAKPVIGGRTGPQSCVINSGQDGLLVRPGDVAELTAALERILYEPGLGAALGRAGLERTLREFSWEQVVNRAEHVYRTVASRAGGASD